MSVTTQSGLANAYGAWSEGTSLDATATPSSITLGGSTTVSTSGPSAYGLYASSGGSISSYGGSVTTQGSNAAAIYATGAHSIVTINPLAGVGAAIATYGGGSPGAQADSGGVVILNGGSVTTYGAGSDGLSVAGGTSTITANGVSITTGAGGGAGVYASGQGTAALNGGSVTTSGDNAPGLYATGAGSTLTTTDVSGPVQVSTSGADSPGAQAASGATLSLNGGSVAAAGVGASGVMGSGSGTAVSLSNVAVTTTGGYDAATGAFAQALLMTQGAVTTVTGGSIKTTGDSATAVNVDSGGVAKLTGTTIGVTGDGSAGLAVHAAGSEIDATNVMVKTTGGRDSITGDDAYGLYNGPFGSSAAGGVAKIASSSISTQGAGMYGVYTSTGGATTLTGTAVATAGVGALGLIADSGGTTSVTGGSVSTTGAAAYAVAVNTGGAVTLNGATVSATGAGSGGVGINGAASNLSASGVNISTSGGHDAVSGQNAYGVTNGSYGSSTTSGGTASFTDSTIATSAEQMVGVYTTTGGTTTLAATTVTTAGAGAVGVESTAGGVTNLSGGSVATSGQGAHALVATGAGSQVALAGSNTFATQGAGAVGLYAAGGGVISGTGTATITTAGGVSPATGLGADGVDADGANSQIRLGAATITTSGAGAFGLMASDAAASGSAGSITASGTLAITTTNASATAVGLQGNGASILATGGGTITSTGRAIAFTGGTNQTATFDNFTIANQSGDLIFADPSEATVNFNSTTANAGLNNLLNATGGSAVTLNANASTLTGRIQTDSASTSTVNLSNGTSWTMTGSSVISNFAVSNSVVVFAPPASGTAFRTLTLVNYAGAGATMTMNATLSGAGSMSDQIIINGGKATGSTALNVNNINGLGGQTTGNGIPLIVAKNGGTIASNAFVLSNVLIVGGYRYTLNQTAQGDYLVSSPVSPQPGPTPTPTPQPPSPVTPGLPGLTPAEVEQAAIANSVANVAKAQQQAIVTGRVLSSILLGATEQVNCSNCSSGFGSIGSFALGAHGRTSLTPELTAMGGFSYDEYNAPGIAITNSPTFAGSLVYDPINFGRSRPFFEVGGGFVPFEQVSYTRTYPNGFLNAQGQGNAIDRSLGLFGRIGWVDRVTPIDEAAVYTDISRSWLVAGGYTEAYNGGNPYPATVSTSLTTLDVLRLGGQYTHLFGGQYEVNVSAAVAYGFNAANGSQWNIADYGAVAPGPIGNSVWYEWGARVGYRLGQRLVIDAFMLGTLGGEVGTTIHGGVGLRYLF